MSKEEELEEIKKIHFQFFIIIIQSKQEEYFDTDKKSRNRKESPS